MIYGVSSVISRYHMVIAVYSRVTFMFIYDIDNVA